MGKELLREVRSQSKGSEMLRYVVFEIIIYRRETCLKRLQSTIFSREWQRSTKWEIIKTLWLPLRELMQASICHMNQYCTTLERKCSIKHHLQTVHCLKMLILDQTRSPNSRMDSRTPPLNPRVYKRRLVKLTQWEAKVVREETVERPILKKTIYQSQ